MTNIEQPNKPTSFVPAVTDDVDLTKVLRTLRRYWLPLVLLPTMVAAGTYTLLGQVPPTYQARTSLMAGLPDNANQAISGAVVTASQLPQGAVGEVIHSRSVVKEVIGTIEASGLPEPLKAKLSSDLLKELSSGQYSRITVKPKLDQWQRGVYDLTSIAETPAAAQVLANAAAQALLAWDTNRAKRGVARARQNIRQQLDNVTARLNSLPPSSLERESLVAARGQLLLNLSQATVFEQGVTGSLVLLAEANDPNRPISPKPLRNAALAFVLTLFATMGIILLSDSLSRRVRTAEDIPPGLPLLGRLPHLARTPRAQVVGLARIGALYEAAGFIQVNLLSQLQGKRHAIVAVTSARPTEGKSTVVAVTACALALSGRRVLIIDLDLYRPAQHEYWQIMNETWRPMPGATLPPMRQTSVIQAVENPQHASVLNVADGIDLMPAQAVGRRSSAVLNSPALRERLREWAQHYDVVLLDTPPVLSVPDAFVVSRDSDGIVMVVESGSTPVRELDQVLQSFETTQSKLLGLVLNKVARSRDSYSYYTYNNVDRPKTV